MAVETLPDGAKTGARASALGLRPLKAAATSFMAAAHALRRVRWRRFASLRFLGTTLAAIGLVQLIPNTANAPGGAAQAAANQIPYVGFAAALRESYAEIARAEQAALGPEFDPAPLDRALSALEAHTWPDPEHPAKLGLGERTAVAVDEARIRLLRLWGLGARETHPREAARAQVALACWALRAALRRDRIAIDECADRFFHEVLALEDRLLPLKTDDPFRRRLAREYLAYANYKAEVEGDHIDARHFAAKGLRAADAQGPVEPEELERWFALDRSERRELSLWRLRLEIALEQHRAGERAETAAVALARYDCWVDRAAEHAHTAKAGKCRGEFIDAVRRLEGAGGQSAIIAVRLAYDRLALGAGARDAIARAARLALDRNATVSVAAAAWPRGRAVVETRQAWRRAETVADALAEMGVPAERIRLLQRKAFDSENEAGLRRVDIVIE